MHDGRRPAASPTPRPVPARPSSCGALRELGVDGDQRVATLLWNNSEHLEAYLAVPSMGAVLHTLNLRLDPRQLSYIANHAGDYVIITEPTLVPLLAADPAQPGDGPAHPWLA